MIYKMKIESRYNFVNKLFDRYEIIIYKLHDIVRS